MNRAVSDLAAHEFTRGLEKSATFMNDMRVMLDRPRRPSLDEIKSEMKRREREIRNLISAMKC